MSKPKLAIYWAASCGGCDVSILDIHEHILDVDKNFELVLWPVAADFKYKDIEIMQDQEIFLTLFNGSIRNSENEHIAKLLRKKSKVLVAFGSCAHLGGIIGLANLYKKEDILDTVYNKSISTHNPDKIIPKTTVQVKEGELTLPKFYNYLRSLDQVVDVDYYIPGCPPNPEQVVSIVKHVIEKKPLPPKGSVLGAGEKSQCEECKRKKNIKKIREIKRIATSIPDPETCLLEQGFLCIGPATRSGCGVACVNAGVPCRGCYGPPPNVMDQGAKMLSAIASVIDSESPDEINKIIEQIIDPVGTFYRFSLPTSLLRRSDI
ncbi:MAG: oxidoreductase [Deltaproteobacteria bacterium]|nr:oxidoreductase [Deltaproteobacteria bacterium]